MKIKSPLNLTLGLLAAASTILIASASQAATFNVVVDTSALAASAPGTYSLDFQFNDGGVLGNNTALVSGFFGVTGLPTPTTFDGAVGDIGSVVFFNNSGSFQELYQSFVAGSVFGFTVDLTTNSDGVTPDSFVFTILDNSLSGPFGPPSILTTGLGNSLFQVSIGATPTVQIGTGVSPFVSVSAIAVPEPTSTVALLGLGCVGLFIGKRKKALSK